MSPAIDWVALREAALSVRAHAHAPYSHFSVGAALLGSDGRLWGGCNVENASYGLTVCAERSALFAAVAAGCTSFRALAVVSSAAEPVTPCGACRQVLVEFAPSFEVRCYGTDGSEVRDTTAGLLPHAFGRHSLG